MQLTLARLTWKQQAGVGLGASAAVIGCVHVLWLGPARDGIAAQRRTLATLRNDVARAGMTERTLPDLQQLQGALRLRLAAVHAAAPREEEVPEVLREAQTIAEESGLWITGFKPAAAVASQHGTERSVTLEFDATYAAVEGFLTRLADHPRLVMVAALRLRAADQPSEETTLTGSCRLTTFVPRRARDGAAAAAPEPSPRAGQETLATSQSEVAGALP
jgi:Tfp pilus assembly protein PilO